VIAEGEEGEEEVKKNGWVDRVYLLPDLVVNLVWTRS